MSCAGLSVLVPVTFPTKSLAELTTPMGAALAKGLSKIISKLMFCLVLVILLLSRARLTGVPVPCVGCLWLVIFTFTD